jgi:hypothetical protein
MGSEHGDGKQGDGASCDDPEVWGRWREMLPELTRRHVCSGPIAVYAGGFDPGTSRPVGAMVVDEAWRPKRIA